MDESLNVLYIALDEGWLVWLLAETAPMHVCMACASPDFCTCFLYVVCKAILAPGLVSFISCFTGPSLKLAHTCAIYALHVLYPILRVKEIYPSTMRIGNRFSFGSDGPTCKCACCWTASLGLVWPCTHATILPFTALAVQSSPGRTAGKQTQFFGFAIP